LGADSRRIRGCLKRIASTALAVIAAACLSACGGGPGSPSSGSSFWSSATSLLSRSTKVAVAPIIGTPPQVAQDLTEALVAAGKDRSLTLIPGTGNANYTLRGYLVASSEKGGSKISYIWDVTDAKGERVARVSGDELIAARAGSDPWSGVDSGALRSIAGKTTSQLAATLSRGGSSAAAVASSEGSPATTAAAPRPTAAPSPKSAGVIVAPVSGAPGDGQRSLTTALKKRLYAGGIKLANGVAENVYTVKGSVVLSDASGGKQSIRIDWLVLDPSGKRLGTVSQQNTIPRGSLNGPWGAIADAAAGAAADGIIKLLPKSS
jgi:hypothetical protein